MKRILMSLAAMATFAVALPSWAGNGIDVNGPHYNLNIIGVENPKNPAMNGGDGHTIFVALGSSGRKTPADTVETDIWLTPGDFRVCDANGFDYAYKCDGTQIGRGLYGAVFQLPCNTAETTDYRCEEGTASASYSVWGRALGQPGGSAVITTCAYDKFTDEVVCSTDNTVDVFSRGSGKQIFQDVTKELTTLQDVCFYINATTEVCDKSVSLFNDVLEDYFWKYENKGLRLAQIRFYLNPAE
ncbi:MAG TPA: hypothetical protein VKH46_09135 [Thermoanaerobaculia bacterium]|nr:hypothetical protein [Thermoanaerobaculia bacterium]